MAAKHNGEANSQSSQLIISATRRIIQVAKWKFVFVQQNSVSSVDSTINVYTSKWRIGTVSVTASDARKQEKETARPAKEREFRNTSKLYRHQLIGVCTIPTKIQRISRKFLADMPNDFLYICDCSFSLPTVTSTNRKHGDQLGFVYLSMLEHEKILLVLLLSDWAQKNKSFVAPIRSQNDGVFLELVR